MPPSYSFFLYYAYAYTFTICGEAGVMAVSNIPL